MSFIRIATNFNIDIEFTAAPFYKRLIAWALDLILQVFYLVVATRFLQWIARRMDSTSDNEYNMWGISLLLLLPFLLYHIVCEISMNGQSVGKKLMHIRVVNENGGRPGISQLVIRWLVRTSDYTLLMIMVYIPYALMFGGQYFGAVAAAVILLFTDLILVNATQKGQRLGDLLAHTLLISTRESGTIEDTVFLEVADHYKPQFPEVMRLADHDINAVKAILDASRKRNDYALAEKASHKIQAHLNIQTSLSAYDFLEVLLKDYNYLSVN